jgi:hypothetical protein
MRARDISKPSERNAVLSLAFAITVVGVIPIAEAVTSLKQMVVEELFE